MVSFDPEGRRVVAGPVSLVASRVIGLDGRALRVWDLESGQERVCSVAHLTNDQWWGVEGAGFAHDGSVYAVLGGMDRLVRLTLPDGPGGECPGETILTAGTVSSSLSRDGRFLLVHASETQSALFQFEDLVLFDLVKGTSRRITTHGTRLMKVAKTDPTGRILVTGDVDGVVRVGPITGEEPHLLLGHEWMVTGLAISPDSQWIATASDQSVRLWPMPDVTRPPLHTLPHDELLARLDSFTNLRAVRDETSSTGWTLEVGPFPGWETVPES
jgi:WD40 repeat protein